MQLLPTMVGSRVRISASSCNIGIRDANCWFDSSALVRRFALDLSNPFERAVGLLILYLIASHQTYILGVSEYYDPDTKTTTNLGTYRIYWAYMHSFLFYYCMEWFLYTISIENVYSSHLYSF